MVRGHIHQRNKGVLISAVSVHADEGAHRTVSCNFSQSLDSHGRSPSSERGHDHQHPIFLVNHALGKISLRITQIDHPFLSLPSPQQKVSALICICIRYKYILLRQKGFVKTACGRFARSCENIMNAADGQILLIEINDQGSSPLERIR